MQCMLGYRCAHNNNNNNNRRATRTKESSCATCSGIEASPWMDRKGAERGGGLSRCLCRCRGWLVAWLNWKDGWMDGDLHGPYLRTPPRTHTKWIHLPDFLLLYVFLSHPEGRTDRLSC